MSMVYFEKTKHSPDANDQNAKPKMRYGFYERYCLMNNFLKDKYRRRIIQVLARTKNVNGKD